MNLTNFKQIRINDAEPFVDIKAFGNHISYGICIQAYEWESMNDTEKRKIEIRKLGREIAMFVYKFSDLELPERWENAEVVYSWEQP